MDDAYRDTVETLGAALTSIKEALLILEKEVSDLREENEELKIQLDTLSVFLPELLSYKHSAETIIDGLCERHSMVLFERDQVSRRRSTLNSMYEKLREEVQELRRKDIGRK